MTTVYLKESKTASLNNLDVPTYTESGDRRAADVNIVESASYRSSFGDYMSESLDSVSQISAQYGLSNKTETFSATGGTATGGTDNQFICTTGTNVGGYGVIRTKRPTIYREGKGLMARFTAIFDSGAVANSLQFAGLFNVQDTIAFGYRGANFGILFDNYGAQEIRELTFTVAGNGNLSLTLNTVLYTIPITTGTTAHNAYEVTTWLNANQSVWDAGQAGAKVTIRNKSVTAAAGTYSVTGAGATAALSQIEAGAAQTNQTILESAWNGEAVSFDKTKGNVYMIKVSYLGFGPISFYILCPDDRVFKRVHTIDYQNNYTKPSLSNRALKIGWVAASLGSTTALTVKGSSAATFIEGESKLDSESHSETGTNASVSTSFLSVITLRAALTFGNKAMLGRVVLEKLIVSTDSQKEVVFKLCKNATLGETNFSYHDQTDSVVLKSTVSLADTGTAHAITGGQLGANGSATLDLKALNIDFFSNETITVFARVVSGAASSVTATITWKEDL
jgi:hypothetical protein